MIFLLELIIIMILVFVNGFFSAAEIAVITVRKTKIKELVNKKIPFAKTLEKLKSDIEKFFITIQIGITIVGTLASVIAGTISVKYLSPMLSYILGKYSQYSEAISIAITTILITAIFLLFGELLPKSIATRKPVGIALISSSFIDIFSKIMSPFIYIINLPHQWIVRLVMKQNIYSENKISEDEIRLIIEEGVSSGVLEKQEQELIEKIFGFTDTKAKDIMIGIESVDMISINNTKEEIIDKIIATGHSRFPVYDKTKDNIIGIMTARDFYYVYFESEAFILKDILRKPITINSEEKISNLLREMQKKKIHMALVKDSSGIIGIITLEDIVEEIIGEIEDERFSKIK